MSYRPDGLDTKSDYTPPPMIDHTTSVPRKTPTMGKVLIVVGLVILMIGVVVAAIPMTWKSTQDIVNDWKGGDVGYYGSYEEGDKVKVIGEITFEISIDDILEDNINYTEDEMNYYMSLKSQGYNYAYFLDYIYGLEIYSQTDLGDIGEEVSLELTLDMKNLGGSGYWVWTGKSIEKQNAALYYAIGIPIIVLGIAAAFFGVKKYLAATRIEKPEPPKLGNP